MIHFKNGRIGADFARLREENPQLYVLVITAADWVWREYKQHTFITSLYRPADTDSVHAYWRGCDLRVYHEDRRGSVREDEQGWSPAAVEEACAYLNLAFIYGDDHVVAIPHGEGLHFHVHLQTPEKGSWWGEAAPSPNATDDLLSFSDEAASAIQGAFMCDRTAALQVALQIAEKAKARL